jgi:hypothetical protein
LRRAVAANGADAPANIPEFSAGKESLRALKNGRKSPRVLFLSYEEDARSGGNDAHCRAS